MPLSYFDKNLDITENGLSLKHTLEGLDIPIAQEVYCLLSLVS